MVEFTKIVRSLASASPNARSSKLRKAVGLPFWLGILASGAIAFYSLNGLLRPEGGLFLSLAVSLLAGVVGGLLIQALYDLVLAIRSGEVQKRYALTLVAVILLAFIYGIIYYKAPESGFERIFSVASLIITSALFGYVVGRAKGR
jgi:hypothetical protein